ncbi:hypothetical protein ACWD26_27410 [Streptomyces sp. NPDC002787]
MAVRRRDRGRTASSAARSVARTSSPVANSSMGFSVQSAISPMVPGAKLLPTSQDDPLAGASASGPGLGLLLRSIALEHHDVHGSNTAMKELG